MKNNKIPPKVQCPFYQMNDPDKVDPAKTGTYPRSAQGGNQKFNNKVQYLPTKAFAASAHQGTYTHPYHIGQVNEKQGMEIESTSLPNSEFFVKCENVHDILLEHRLNQCKLVVQEVSKKQDQFDDMTHKIKVAGGNNDYPCIALTFENVNDDVHPNRLEHIIPLMIPYFVAIANQRSKNLGIEMHIRSSFGHLTPSIAPCGNSLRIELGVTPQKYATKIAETIVDVGKVFNELYNEDLNLNLLPTESGVRRALNEVLEERGVPRNKVENDNKQYFLNKIANSDKLIDVLDQDVYDKYNSKKNGNISKPSTKTYAEEIYRKHVTLLALTGDIFTKIQHDGEVTSFIKAPFEPLKTSLSKLSLNKETGNHNLEQLQAPGTKQTSKKLRRFNMGEIKNMEEIGQDTKFITLLKRLLINTNNKPEFEKMNYGAAIKIIQDNNMQHLRQQCNNFNKLVKGSQYSNNVNSEIEDDYGSDSEYQYTIDVPIDKSDSKNDNKGTPITLHSKKFTTINGMMALNQAYYVLAKLVNNKGPIVDCEHTYYETKKMLEFSVIKPNKIISDSQKASKIDILMFDLEAFNSSNINQSITIEDKLKSYENLVPKYIVLDTTSSQAHKMNDAIDSCFRSGAEVVICVTSGLKQSQGGLDVLPFGTQRIFAQTGSKFQSVVNEYERLHKALKDDKNTKNHAFLSTYAHNMRRILKGPFSLNKDQLSNARNESLNQKRKLANASFAKEELDQESSLEKKIKQN